MKRCPRDRQILATNDVDGYRYYSCSKCKGYLVPGAALRNTMQAEAIADFITKTSKETATSIPCPECDSHMVTIRVQECEIDICPACNAIWLDQDEVLRISSCFRENSAILMTERDDQDTKSQSHKPLFILLLLEILGGLIGANS